MQILDLIPLSLGLGVFGILYSFTKKPFSVSQESLSLFQKNISSTRLIPLVLRVALLCTPLLCFSFFCLWGAYTHFFQEGALTEIRSQSFQTKNLPDGSYSTWTLGFFLLSLGISFLFASFRLILLAQSSYKKRH